MNYKERIKELFSKGDGRVIDLFYEVYCYVCSLESSEQMAAIQYICDNAKNFENDEKDNIIIPKHYKDGMLERYWKNANRFRSAIKELAYDLSKNNVDSKEFYSLLWNNIISNKICKNKHEKALALFLVVDSKYIPYRAVGIGLSMENEQFNELSKKIAEKMMKDVDLILQIDYEQKTQRASLLVEKLCSCETFEEKSVFLSMLIDKLESDFKEKLEDYINEG